MLECLPGSHSSSLRRGSFCTTAFGGCGRSATVAASELARGGDVQSIQSQIPNRRGVGFGQDGEEQVSPCDRPLTRSLCIEDRALHRMLKSVGRTRVSYHGPGMAWRRRVCRAREPLPCRNRVDSAGLHDRDRVRVFSQTQQHMLHGRLALPSLHGGLKSAVQRRLQIAREEGRVV